MLFNVGGLACFVRCGRRRRGAGTESSVVLQGRCGATLDQPAEIQDPREWIDGITG